MPNKAEIAPRVIATAQAAILTVLTAYYLAGIAGIDGPAWQMLLLIGLRIIAGVMLGINIVICWDIGMPGAVARLLPAWLVATARKERQNMRRTSTQACVVFASIGGLFMICTPRETSLEGIMTDQAAVWMLIAALAWINSAIIQRALDAESEP